MHALIPSTQFESIIDEHELEGKTSFACWQGTTGEMVNIVVTCLSPPHNLGAYLSVQIRHFYATKMHQKSRYKKLPFEFGRYVAS